MLQRTSFHFGDGDDGSRQRSSTKSLKALRHFASDRVAGEKLMERGFLNLWVNRNASKARAFRKKWMSTLTRVPSKQTKSRWRWS